MSSKLSVSDLSDSEYKGKSVFVRVDLNVPLKEGKISNDYRIKQALPTIKYVLERGAKVILASHLGRPKGKIETELSLKPVAKKLSEHLEQDVKFPGEVVGENVISVAKNLNDGEVMLLENLRFHSGETSNDDEFASTLASLAQIYVNDAFGTCHRAHASTQGMAKYFEIRLAGLLISKELEFLGSLLDNPQKPYVVIVGGAKIKDKISALKNLIEKADKVLIGGVVAYTFLSAKGVNVGKSLVEKEMADWAKKALRDYDDKIELPVDHIASDSIENSDSIKVVNEKIPDELMGLDIGPKTVSNFTSHIGGDGTVFWNGPMGLFENDNYLNGTMSIARAMALATWRGATSVIGGGDSISALTRSRVPISEINHVSTGGGASLEFLGGDELPGISVLSDK